MNDGARIGKLMLIFTLNGVALSQAYSFYSDRLRGHGHWLMDGFLCLMAAASLAAMAAAAAGLALGWRPTPAKYAYPVAVAASIFAAGIWWALRRLGS